MGLSIGLNLGDLEAQERRPEYRLRLRYRLRSTAEDALLLANISTLHLGVSEDSIR